MTNYKSTRIIDGKPRKVIVDENRKIINKNPKKDELKSIPLWNFKHNVKNTCEECGIDFDNLKSDHPRKEYDEKENWTGRWLCNKCVQKCDPNSHNNIRKLLTRITDKNVYRLRSNGNYNGLNICDECKVEKLKPGNARREYDENENWTGRWLCERCGNIHRSRLPNSRNSEIKRIANRRTGNLDPNSTQAKGDLFEELTCIWKRVKNLNIENDNFESPIDHSIDPIKGSIYQTKGRLFDGYRWNQNIESEHYKEFDILIFYCANANGTIIERIYEIPREEILKWKSISIFNDLQKRWYDKYRINNEITMVNDIWKKLKE